MLSVSLINPLTKSKAPWPLEVYRSPSQTLTEEGRAGVEGRRQGRPLLTGLLPAPAQPAPSYYPEPPAQGWLRTVGGALQHQLAVKKTPASQSDGDNSPVGFPVSICIQLAAKIGLHVEEEEEFSLVLLKTPLTYTDKLSFTRVECSKTKTWLRDNGLKVIKRSLPFGEY